MAIAQFTLVLVVANKTKSLYGTLIYDTPFKSKTGLSRYYFVAIICAQ